jgi:hypothetical protein
LWIILSADIFEGKLPSKAWKIIIIKKEENHEKNSCINTCLLLDGFISQYFVGCG